MRRLGVIVLITGFLAGAGIVPAGSGEIPKDERYTVRWGDTLARIARRYYGDGKMYPRIAAANRLKDPHHIVCGTVLAIPRMTADARHTEAATDAVPAVCGTEAAVPKNEAAGPVFCWRQESSNIFCAGENLLFSVKWKFIPVGSATMEIKNIEEVNGRSAYHIVTSARSSSFFDNFYKVRDVNESWMDTESLCSLKFATHICENDIKRNETIFLDHQKQQFQIIESSKTGTIPLWVQDVLSSLYYLRTKKLVVGQDFCIDAHSGDKSWPLRVKVVRRETVEVPAGRFSCYLVEPSIREGAGIFEAKGKLQVWLTADEKKVPVLMRSKIAVGSVDAELVRMQLK